MFLRRPCLVSSGAALLAAALFALLLLPAPASAQYFGRNKVQWEKFDWQVLKTEHFDIYFYPEEEQAVRDAARMAERWYDRLVAGLRARASASASRSSSTPTTATSSRRPSSAA